MRRILPPLAWLALKGLAAAYRHRGPVSAHFDGETFHNDPPLGDKSRREMRHWQREHRQMLPWVWQPGPSTSQRLPVGPSADGIRVTFVNHATFLVQMAGLNLLTDPVWSRRVSPLSFAGPRRYHPPGIALEALPPIDAILVSHNHYDHLDLWSLRQLARRFPQARIVTGLGNAALCKALGFTNVDELDWWQELRLSDDVYLTATPARHWSARSLWDRRRTLWLSFVIESPAGAVYFAGDTGFGPHFARIAERFGAMTLSLLPIGAFQPRWFMHDVHMGPDEAVAAHAILRSQHSVACHFGCFALANDGQFEPQQALAEARRAAGLEANAFIVPTPGQSICFARNTAFADERCV